MKRTIPPRIILATGTFALVFFLTALMMVNSASVLALTFNISGDLGSAGPFGGTGLEDGRFSGTFSYDLGAVDQYPDTEPFGDIFGIYDLTEFDIEFFLSSGPSVGAFSSASGGIGDISITPEPLTVDTFGNVGIELSQSADAFGQSSSVLAIFGLWFDLNSITTDALPSDLSGASYTGDGIFAFLAGSPDAPATFVESASISSIPEPATILLLGTGLVGVVGAAKRRKKNQA